MAVLSALGVAALAATPPTPSETSASTPEQVLRRYVKATLSANDNVAAAALVCHHPRLQAMRRWHDELTDSMQRLHLPAPSADVTGYTTQPPSADRSPQPPRSSSP